MSDDAISESRDPCDQLDICIRLLENDAQHDPAMRAASRSIAAERLRDVRDGLLAARRAPAEPASGRRVCPICHSDTVETAGDERLIADLARAIRSLSRGATEHQANVEGLLARVAARQPVKAAEWCKCGHLLRDHVDIDDGWNRGRCLGGADHGGCLCDTPTPWPVEAAHDKARDALARWQAQQGHDKCWYYPEIFRELCAIFGVESREREGTVPSAEFVEGCQRYHFDLYGQPSVGGEGEPAEAAQRRPATDSDEELQVSDRALANANALLRENLEVAADVHNQGTGLICSGHCRICDWIAKTRGHLAACDERNGIAGQGGAAEGGKS